MSTSIVITDTAHDIIDTSAIYCSTSDTSTTVVLTCYYDQYTADSAMLHHTVLQYQQQVPCCVIVMVLQYMRDCRVPGDSIDITMCV